MGDAAGTSRAGVGAVPAEQDSAVLTPCVYSEPQRALAAYSLACEGAVVSPTQRLAWIETWVKHLTPDFIVATLGPATAPVFAVALEISRTGSLRTAHFVGDKHSNGNFPPLRGTVSAADIRSLTDAIHRRRPDIDIVAFERLAERCGGVANPLIDADAAPSANLALAVDLSGGFEALLTRVSGKRKRKKHRSQQRKFEAAGGFRRLAAKTPGEVDAMLDAFFVMKDDRFRKLGIANVFGPPGVQAFFRALFKQALAGSPPAYVLHGLEVAGRLRAVTGSSRTGNRLVCEFGSIAEDELSSVSPGDFLFFENIREACEEKLAIYDFSVGDEPYKRLWCDIEITQYDVLVPLTRRGHVLATALRAGNRMKSFVKKSPLVWRIAKAVRKRSVKAGSAPEE